MAGNNSTSGEAAADVLRDYREAAVDKVETYGDALQDAGDTAAAKVHDAKATAASIADDLKGRASAHIDDAKSIVSSMAEEARSRISDIVEQQKSLGADKLSGISRAAQNAAGDLDQQNPHVARIVRDAASSVDRFAGDLRTRSLTDVVTSVSAFARKQPVAFFAGSVLAGFVLARFLKSEPAAGTDDYYSRADRT